MSQLQQKHVQVQSMCPVCSEGDETILHGLVLFFFASQCWRRLIPDIQVGEVHVFSDWLSQVLNKCGHDRRAEIAMISWAIWKARNDLVWNHKRSSVNKVIDSAKEYLTQWKSAQVRSTRAFLHPMLDGDGASSWVKPQTDTVKITVDAAFFNDQEEFGLGLVARDSEGELVHAKTILHHGFVTPEIAEVLAVKEALSWIKKTSWSKVDLESDCLVAVQVIRGRVRMRSPFGLVVEECRQSIRQLNKVSLYFIKRSANMMAHQFAKTSYMYLDRSFNRSSVPIELKNRILADLSS